MGCLYNSTSEEEKLNRFSRSQTSFRAITRESNAIFSWQKFIFLPQHFVSCIFMPKSKIDVKYDLKLKISLNSRPKLWFVYIKFTLTNISLVSHYLTQNNGFYRGEYFKKFTLVGNRNSDPSKQLYLPLYTTSILLFC